MEAYFLALDGHKTVKDLAEELDETPNTIAQVFSRDQRKPASKQFFAKSLTGDYWSKLHRESF